MRRGRVRHCGARSSFSEIEVSNRVLSAPILNPNFHYLKGIQETA